MKTIIHAELNGRKEDVPDSNAELEARIEKLETRLGVVEHNLNIIVELLKNARTK
jgi:hypothetical protein